MTASRRQPPGSRSGTRLCVDLDALVRNYRRVGAAAGAESGAAVKADAYGLGVAAVAPALRAAGCRHFFVATLDEGLALRAVLADADIHVLEGLRRDRDASAMAAARLRPVLVSPGQAAAWQQFLAGQRTRLPATLHVDTGMTRLGLDIDEAGRLVADHPALVRLGIDLLMTHFSCADVAGHPATAAQLARFAAVHARAPHLRTSLGNSAASLGQPALAGDLARPGIALYGGNPFADGRPTPVEAVATWLAEVLQVRTVPEGTPVGYGESFVTTRRTRVATVGAGYADGYPRLLGNRACVGVAGQRAPVIGRVSMDLVTVDVTDVPDSAVVPGTEVELCGATIGVDEVAGWADSVAYEILTGIGPRVTREYGVEQPPR